MPWCPKCGLEYIEGVKTCHDCGVPLRDSPMLKDAPVSRDPAPLPGSGKLAEKDWVPVAQVNNAQEAEMIIGLLDSEGIHAVTLDHLSVFRQLYGDFPFFGEKIKIYVSRQQAAEAALIIRGETNWSDSELREAMSDQGGFERMEDEEDEEL